MASMYNLSINEVKVITRIGGKKPVARLIKKVGDDFSDQRVINDLVAKGLAVSNGTYVALTDEGREVYFQLLKADEVYNIPEPTIKEKANCLPALKDICVMTVAKLDSLPLGIVKKHEDAISLAKLYAKGIAEPTALSFDILIALFSDINAI